MLAAQHNPTQTGSRWKPLKEEASVAETTISVALLTGGGDKPYALGLASALMAQGINLDFIGSDEVDSPQLHENSHVNFLNLRGNQRTDVSQWRKGVRVLAYYLRLLAYAATAQPRVFHILWNNKFEFFDRTILMLYYRLLGKRIVFTAHNVNAGKRDANDSWRNRFSLKVQYRLSHRVFVHTGKMKRELMREFGVPEGKVVVIPFGINNSVPKSSITTLQARHELGISPNHKVLLFFGNIAPYKGLEYLVSALARIAGRSPDYRLVIAGRPKGCEDYWDDIRQQMSREGIERRIVQRIEYIPDEKVEVFFKAADVLILPYTHIFQSGVLFLGYNFGLPVIAADVGSLKEDIVEGKTGFVFEPGDAADLARKIEAYFAHELFKDLEQRREEIAEYAARRYSWSEVGEATHRVYQTVMPPRGASSNRELET